MTHECFLQQIFICPVLLPANVLKPILGAIAAGPAPNGSYMPKWACGAGS